MTALSSIISAGGGAPAAPVAGDVKSITTGYTTFGQYTGVSYIALPAHLTPSRCVVDCTVNSDHNFTHQGATSRVVNYGSGNQLAVTKTWGDSIILNWSIVEYV